MNTLFAIRIAKITNNLLINKGWKVGKFVCLSYNAYSGDTFDLPLNHDKLFVSFERRVAEKELHKRCQKFVGVEFEIISFEKDYYGSRNKICF